MSEAVSTSIEDLDPAGVLTRAVQRRRCADRAEAELLGLAAHWADLHAVLSGGPAAGFTAQCTVGGLERLVPLAGDGTPPVAEFAPAELGAALSMSTYAAALLVGDALELRHRLPRLWARIMDGTLPAWRGRQVAAHTRALSRPAAAWVDAQVAPFAHKIGLARILGLVEAAVLRYDPQAAADRARAAADQRGVWTSDTMLHGTRSIRIEADALDAAAFDQTIGQIAEGLGRLGDTDRVEIRRAKAVGVIADPQATLDLLTAPDPDHESTTTAGTGTTTRRAGGRPRITLYIHLHESALHSHPGAAAGPDATTGSGGPGGVARVEGLGPVTLDQLRDWLGRSEVRIQPVLDLANRAAVDAYEVPDRIAETVTLRNPCCPFPWCNNLSRTKDTDHITAYLPREHGGPPGQTTGGNLARPCRRHHRLKTHGGWSYTMPEPGLYLWRSPAGRRYLVDHTGTTNLPHPDHPSGDQPDTG